MVKSRRSWCYELNASVEGMSNAQLVIYFEGISAVFNILNRKGGVSGLD